MRRTRIPDLHLGGNILWVPISAMLILSVGTGVAAALHRRRVG